MNGVPPLVRAVAMVLIGLPGGLLWVGGMLSLLLSCWNLPKILQSGSLEAVVFLGGSFALTAVGFAMVTCAEILNEAKRYRMPGAKLLLFLGFELIEGLLAVALVGAALTAIDSLSTGALAAGAAWISLGVILALLLVTVHRTRRSKGQLWRAEAVDLPPPVTPSP